MGAERPGRNPEARSERKARPAFFVDSMLGRLATWMRILGFDAAYEREIDDSELIDRAEREGRIILTRDTLLMNRRRVRERGFFVEGDRYEEQLASVVKRFGLPREGFLTRCVRCNVPLDAVEKESVEGSVPPYVYATQKRFSRCPLCGRIYWAGTHRERMAEKISAILGQRPEDG